MKKILLTTAICLIGAASMMAQGRVAFANTSATPIRISDGTVTSVLGTASTAVFGVGPASATITLVAGLDSASMSPVLIGTAANQASIFNTASLVATFQGTFAGGSPLPLPGYDGSAPVFFQFTASVTPSSGQYAGMLFRGVSPIIAVTPTLSPAAQAPMFGVAGGNLWTGLTMTMVPEPSSMALAGLGAASLLLFRRRK